MSNKKFFHSSTRGIKRGDFVIREISSQFASNALIHREKTDLHVDTINTLGVIFTDFYEEDSDNSLIDNSQITKVFKFTDLIETHKSGVDVISERILKSSKVERQEYLSLFAKYNLLIKDAPEFIDDVFITSYIPDSFSSQKSDVLESENFDSFIEQLQHTNLSGATLTEQVGIKDKNDSNKIKMTYFVKWHDKNGANVMVHYTKKNGEYKIINVTVDNLSADEKHIASLNEIAVVNHVNNFTVMDFVLGKGNSYSSLEIVQLNKLLVRLTDNINSLDEYDIINFLDFFNNTFYIFNEKYSFKDICFPKFIEWFTNNFDNPVVAKHRNELSKIIKYGKNLMTLDDYKEVLNLFESNDINSNNLIDFSYINALINNKEFETNADYFYKILDSYFNDSSKFEDLKYNFTRVLDKLESNSIDTSKYKLSLNEKLTNVFAETKKARLLTVSNEYIDIIKFIDNINFNIEDIEYITHMYKKAFDENQTDTISYLSENGVIINKSLFDYIKKNGEKYILESLGDCNLDDDIIIDYFNENYNKETLSADSYNRHLDSNILGSKYLSRDIFNQLFSKSVENQDIFAMACLCANESVIEYITPEQFDIINSNIGSIGSVSLGGSGINYTLDVDSFIESYSSFKNIDSKKKKRKTTNGI